MVMAVVSLKEDIKEKQKTRLSSRGIRMSKGKKRPQQRQIQQHLAVNYKQRPTTRSLLDVMIDGREYESTLNYAVAEIDLASEIRKSFREISAARGGRPVACYVANVVNSKIMAPTGIDSSDELPLNELISTAPSTDEIDIILVTPGGSGEQVAKFVEKIRSKYKHVAFLLPNMAMSAGTILAMSGDEIIMSPSSYIGPIDPQFFGHKGGLYPAQALLSLIEDIQERGQKALQSGQNPRWADLQILRNIDAKEIGNAINASSYSIELVKNYLLNFKFRTWQVHQSSGQPVTQQDKERRADEIATLLCSHARWKSHGRGITREVAWEECRLQIIHTEEIPGLERAVRRFWALMNWIFEQTNIYKVILSSDYGLLRIDTSMEQPGAQKT